MFKNLLLLGLFAYLLLGNLSSYAQVVWDLDPTKQLEYKPEKASVYDLPYTMDQGPIDDVQLKRTTWTLFGTGIGAMGVLYLMPSSFTNWEDDGEGPFEKWWDNVSHAPVWDEDDFFLNYVTHPYSGAIYYMGARSAGASAVQSFWYSFALSTFFWEYGIEAFAERPSIQDLIVTPVTGALLGEYFYMVKRDILRDNREVWGSKFLGTTTLFLIDPMTEISNLIFGDDDSSSSSFSFSSQPAIFPQGQIGYRFNIRF